MATRSAPRRDRSCDPSKSAAAAASVRACDAGPTRRLAFALALLVAIAFAPAITQREFAVVDDAGYVAENPMVSGGLSAEGVVWAFGLHGHMGNWHPVTWLSHMTDASLFGLAPGAHKAVNVALHAGATVTGFLALVTLTGRPWPSAFAAALFGVHPLRV